MKRGLAWSLVATVCGAVGSLLVTPVLVSRLGEVRFGLYVLILTLTSYAGFFDFGLTWAAGRFLAEDFARGQRKNLAERFHTLSRFLLGIACLSIAVAMLVAPMILRTAGMDPGTRPLLPLAVAAFSFGLMLQAGLAASLLRACQRFDEAGRVAALGAVLLPAGSYAAVRASVSLVPLLVVNALVNATVLALYLKMIRSELRPAGQVVRWQPRHLREMASFGGWSSISRAVLMMMLQVDRLVVALLGSVAGLTYYAVPANLAARINTLGGPFANIFLSRASLLHAQGSGGELRRQHASAARFLTWTAAAAAAPLVLLGPDFLRVWIGSEMGAKGGTVLTVLALGYAVTAVASLDAVTLEAMGRPDLPAKAMLAWAAVAVASVAALAPAVGSGIVAYAVGGWLVGVGCTNVFMVRRTVLTSLGGEGVAFPFLGLAGSAGAATVAAWFVRPFVENLPTGLLALLVVGGTFTIVGFFSILSESDRGLITVHLKRFVPAAGARLKGAGSARPPVQS